MLAALVDREVIRCFSYTSRLGWMDANQLGLKPMKYKTLFRLLLKIVGVMEFVSGAATFFGYLTLLVFAMIQRGGSNLNTVSSSYVGYLLGPLLEMLFGCYLFFGGGWIVNRAIPSNRPYCHECGYDLTCMTGNICVECGTPFRESEDEMHH